MMAITTATFTDSFTYITAYVSGAMMFQGSEKRKA